MSMKMILFIFEDKNDHLLKFWSVEIIFITCMIVGVCKKNMFGKKKECFVKEYYHMFVKVHSL